jgi:hypothetical protein
VAMPPSFADRSRSGTPGLVQSDDVNEKTD